MPAKAIAERIGWERSMTVIDFDHQRSLKRDVIAHLGTLDFVEAKDNVVFLGPPTTGKLTSFATAAEWVARLGDDHHQGRLHAELTRRRRVPLLIVDKVGYISFDGEAANLFHHAEVVNHNAASNQHRSAGEINTRPVLSRSSEYYRSSTATVTQRRGNRPILRYLHRRRGEVASASHCQSGGKPPSGRTGPDCPGF